MKIAPKKTIKESRFTRTVLLALACGVSMPASAATVYINNFQDAVGAGWSSADYTIGITQAPTTEFTEKFLGEFGNGTVTLSLASLPDHLYTTVSFDLYLIRSWDGNATNKVNNDFLGKDHWKLSLGGTTLFDQTFSNGNPAGQSYSPFPGATSCNPGYNAPYAPGTFNPMTGAANCYNLGYEFNDPNLGLQSMDSSYNLSFTFPHSANDIVLNFSAYGLQPLLTDESWGLDNVRVDVAAVPVPAAVWLFGSGLLGLIGIARRRNYT